MADKKTNFDWDNNLNLWNYENKVAPAPSNNTNVGVDWDSNLVKWSKINAPVTPKPLNIVQKSEKKIEGAFAPVPSFLNNLKTSWTNLASDQYKQANPNTPDILKPIGYAIESPFRIPFVNRLVGKASEMAGGGENSIADNAPFKVYNSDAGKVGNVVADFAGSGIGMVTAPQYQQLGQLGNAGENLLNLGLNKVGVNTAGKLAQYGLTGLRSAGEMGTLGGIEAGLQGADAKDTGKAILQNAAMGAAFGLGAKGAGDLVKGGSALIKNKGVTDYKVTQNTLADNLKPTTPDMTFKQGKELVKRDGLLGLPEPRTMEQKLNVLSNGNTVIPAGGEIERKDPFVRIKKDRINTTVEVPTEYPKFKDVTKTIKQDIEIPRVTLKKERVNSGSADYIKDTDGKPLIVYHGSPEKFDDFDMSKLGKNTGAKSAEEGIFLTSNPKVAESYAYNQNRVNPQTSDELVNYLKELPEDKFNKLSNYIADKYENYDLDTTMDGYSKKYALKVIKNMADEFDAEEGINGLNDMKSLLKKSTGIDFQEQNAWQPNVYKAAVKMKNPFVKDFKGEDFSDYNFTDLLKEAKSKGHDGVVFKGVYDGNWGWGGKSDVYVSFDKKNVDFLKGDNIDVLVKPQTNTTEIFKGYDKVPIKKKITEQVPTNYPQTKTIPKVQINNTVEKGFRDNSVKVEPGKPFEVKNNPLKTSILNETLQGNTLGIPTEKTVPSEFKLNSDNTTIKPTEPTNKTIQETFSNSAKPVIDNLDEIAISKIDNVKDIDNVITELNNAIQKETDPEKKQFLIKLNLLSEGRKKQLSKVYSNTLQKTNMLTDEEKKMLNPKDFQYTVKTEEYSLDKAQQRIDKGVDSAIWELENKTQYNSEDVDTMMQLLDQKLLAEARQTGDYSKVNKMLKNVRRAGTSGGQTVQAFAKYSRTPEGALIDAQRAVDNVEDVLKETKPKTIDKIDSETDTATKAIEKAKKEASKEIEKMLPEQLLANKVSSTLAETKPKQVSLINDMVSELFRVAKESPLPKKPISQKRNPIEFLTEAIQNKGQYTDVWAKAKDIVKAKYKDDPEALDVLNSYFDKGIIPQYSNTTVQNTIKGSLKGLGATLDNIAKSSEGDKESFLKQLTEYIQKTTGASGEDADLLAGKIKEQYNLLINQKAESILNNMFKEVPKAKQKNLREKVMELINLGAYDKENIRNLIKEKEGLPVLSTEDIKYITEHMDKANSLPEGSIEQRGELSLVEKAIQNKVPKGFFDKLKAYRKDAMLLNPITLVSRNPGSNVLLGGMENVKDIPGSLYDTLLSGVLKTDRTTKAPEGIVLRKGNLAGAKRGLSEWGYDLKNGTDTARSRGQMEIAKGDVFKNPILKAVDKTVNLGLQLGDRPFFEAAFDGRMNELAKLKKAGKTSLTDGEMVQDALNLALDRVLQNDSTLSKKASQLRNAFGGFGQFVMPFTQTPANVLDKAIDYSPLGLARGARNTVKLAKDFAGSSDKFVTSQLQKKAVDQLARGTVGTGLMIGGVAAANAGLATGNRDKNNAVNEFNKATGKQDYSLKLGDKYISYDWANPLSMPFAAGVDAAKEKSIGKGLMSGANTVFKQSFLQGLQRLFGSNDPAMGFYQTALAIPGSYFPAVGGRITKTIDPLQRDTSSNSPLGAAINQIKNKVPGLSTQLPGKVDIYGQDMKNFGGNNNLANTMLNPAYTSNYKPTNTDNMLLDLYQNSNDADIFPKVVDDKLTYTDRNKKQQTIVLTPKERNDLQRKLGQKTKYEYDLIARGYKTSNPDSVIKALKTAKDAAWKVVREDYLRSKGVN